MMKRIVLLTAILSVMVVAGTGDEEKIGVPVYPGAEYDEGSTRYLDDVQYLEGAAYRTPADPSTATEFSKKQGWTPFKAKDKAYGATTKTMER